VSELTKPPRAKQLATEDGWLVPDGTLYPCPLRGHGQLACDLGYRYLNGFSYDPRLCHLSNGRWLRMPDSQPTQAQLDTIWDWCQQHGQHLPRWIEHAAGGLKAKPAKDWTGGLHKRKR
jgi:hypothetical protein